jgi:hypothetical protein
MSVSVLFPVRGNTQMVTVPVRGNSGGNTASIFRMFFRPVPLQSYLETAGINRVSCRISPDPDAGSIDLECFSKTSAFYSRRNITITLKDTSIFIPCTFSLIIFDIKN